MFKEKKIQIIMLKKNLKEMPYLIYFFKLKINLKFYKIKIID